ncbi:MAG: TRAP transporter large permease [Thermovirgaceae bacterium]
MASLFQDPAFWALILFIVPLLFRLPIAIALGFAAITVAWFWDLGISMLSYNFFANVAKYPLLAIPFFILAGVIMEKGGIAFRIISFIKAVVGDMNGGLAFAAIAVAVFWGAVSGSSPATVAALGVILIPGMVSAGYDKPFSTAVISVASGLAIIIPPSITFIIYAVITGCSVPGIFAAGIFPGFIMAACLMTSAWFTCRKKGYRGEPRPPLADIGRNFLNAFWALLTPVIILGGIYGGIFTPTEAAAVAVFYGLFVGFFIYRTLTLRIVYECLVTSVTATSAVMLVVACAGLYSWIGSTVGLIEKVSGLLLGISQNGLVVLLTINVILFFAGMILDGVSILYVFMPILIPIIEHFQWNYIWFGVLLTINIAIGTITPPVAVNLYVGSNVSGLSMEELTPPVIPLLVASVVALAIVAVFPSITLFLPKAFGLIG